MVDVVWDVGGDVVDRVVVDLISGGGGGGLYGGV